MKRFFFVSILFLQFNLHSKSNYLIYNPRASIIDYGSYNFDMRFYRKGSILFSSQFAVFQGLNIGFSVDFENFIGTNTIKTHKPNLNVKFEILRNKGIFSGISIGYDEQGFGFYNKETKKYSIREKGVYLVMEIKTSKLSIIPGINANNLDNFSAKDDVYGFIGINIPLLKKLNFIVEGLNLFKNKDIAVYNTCLNWELTENITCQFNIENISDKDNIERTLTVSYTGEF